MIIPSGKEHFTVNIDVQISSQFLSWVFALGEGVQIVGPDSVVERAREEIASLAKQYHVE